MFSGAVRDPGEAKRFYSAGSLDVSRMSSKDRVSGASLRAPDHLLIDGSLGPVYDNGVTGCEWWHVINMQYFSNLPEINSG
jgi:hypothetical protein